MTHTCDFCKQSFKKETTLEVHLCEPKRRFRNRGDRGVQLGFQAYVKFYEQAQGSAKLKTQDDFEQSAYYRAFAKFGNYCYNTHVINPQRFMDWLLKHGKKIDRWASDQLYTEYLTWYVTIEAPADALTRAIEQSIVWQEQTGNPSRDMLRYGNVNALCYEITAGRISAWVIYNSESGQQFLANLTSEQVGMIWPYIDSDTWQKKFADYPADQAWVEDMLKKAGW
jgi:hypothetical protein